MKLYVLIDDITGKKIGGITELNNHEEAKRAYGFALKQKTGPLAIVSYKPIDYRLVCVGDIAEDGVIVPCDPETVCRVDQLVEA